MFAVSLNVSSFWPIDRISSAAATPGQSWPGNGGNEGLPRILQIPCITGTSYCIVSYTGYSLGWGSLPSAENQSVYSIVSADWDDDRMKGWVLQVLIRYDKV